MKRRPTTSTSMLATIAIAAACGSPPKPAAPAAPAAPARPAPSPSPTLPSTTVPVSDGTLDALAPKQSTHGFTPTTVYLDGAGRPMGARFVHDATGFTFDYLRIESAPQGFLWVNTFPTSNKGEPHTQEHLLLGKGDRGRKLGSYEAMSLAESSAFTDQWRTCYHFHTVAGHEAFWGVFEDELDAVLYPDYTDEEIRREVRNFGVDKAADGALHLEEKGTVYNEMVRAYESPDTNVWHGVGALVYGAKHPLAFESGGYPEAIRTMTPGDIRAFHDAAYRLPNMGMVGAFPASMPLGAVLDKTAALLVKEAHGAPPQAPANPEASLPAPAPGAAGALLATPYPAGDRATPSPMMLVWPATRNLDLADRTLLQLFFEAFAGDESTSMYKLVIDSKTRAIDLGASRVWAQVSTDQGEPIFLGVEGVRADSLTDEQAKKLRTIAMAELKRIAALPDGDPELVAFDARVASRVVDYRRRLVKFLDTPPRFGSRGIGAEWINILHSLERASGFKKSVVLAPELAGIERVLAGTSNPWRERVAAWHLTDEPFAVYAKPSPELRKQIDDERGKRVTAELARLGTQYGTKTAAATLAKYQTDYDAGTKAIEAAAKAAPLPPLVDTPPMTYDDELAYTQEPVAGVPGLHATVDSMQSTRVSLAFRLDAIPEEDLVYLAALPQLMSQVGIADGANVIGSAEMRERVRKEILELSVYFIESLHAPRTELQISGAGNDPAEMKAALAWMQRVLFAPDWRLDNLARLRDLVDQRLVALEATMQGAEEEWVRDPHEAWWRQAWPLHLHARSFLTRAHDLHRLRWMLMDPRDAAVTAEVRAWLDKLAAAGKQPKARLVAMIAAKSGAASPAKLSAKAKPIAQAALDDLKTIVAQLPDASLAADWSYLCREMGHDLAQGAEATLAKLGSVRAAIVAAGQARIVEVGSKASLAAIRGDLASLAGKLDKAPRTKQAYVQHDPISERVREHEPAGAGDVRYVGLVDPATSSGVIIDNAPSTALTDTSDDAVLDYLASNTYTGHGAHSLFMKTWAAGLAYSNGIHPLVPRGQLEYYAERCPLLPQTLKFVIDQVRPAFVDQGIARYAVAISFDSRVADGYEERAAELAADIVDGLPPEVVRAFRTRLLAMSRRTDLAAALAARMPKVYGKVLPGYGEPTVGGVYFVIGPDKQLDAYQAYLRATVGPKATLHRLYPRDYWTPAKL